MNTLPENLRPRLNRISLHFDDAEQERRYRVTYPLGMVPITQIALLVGIVMVFLFGFVDAPTDSSKLPRSWALRGGIIVGYALLLLASGSKAYRDHLQALMALAAFSLMVGYAFIMALEPERLAEQYIGMIVILLAAFAVLALQFSVMLLLIATTVLAFSILFLVCGLEMAAMYDALLYMGSSVLLVTLGSYTMDRQRRIAFHIRDEIEREREESRRMALHDPLTGLANRRLLMEALKRAMSRDRRSGRFTALMFIDLDGFKEVNDIHGHEAGDEMMVEIACRLQAVVREVDVVARIGGDEFVVLFEDVESPDNIPLLEQRLLEQFVTPVDIGATEVTVSASIGVARHPGDGQNPDELLHAADIAMYAAKKQGGSTSVQYGQVA